jgi:hypothetical protein
VALCDGAAGGGYFGLIGVSKINRARRFLPVSVARGETFSVLMPAKRSSAHADATACGPRGGKGLAASQARSYGGNARIGMKQRLSLL